jgi:hypothetical protein
MDYVSSMDGIGELASKVLVMLPEGNKREKERESRACERLDGSSAASRDGKRGCRPGDIGSV